MAYATTTQLHQMGLSTAGLLGIATDTKSAMLAACSSRYDDALASGGVYTPPLTTYPASTTLVVCKLAQYELIGVEGYYPDEGTEKVLLERYNQAVKELERLIDGGKLAGVVDSSTDGDGLDDAFPVLLSDTARGWGYGSDPTGDTDDDDLDGI